MNGYPQCMGLHSKLSLTRTGRHFWWRMQSNKQKRCDGDDDNNIAFMYVGWAWELLSMQEKEVVIE